MSRAVRIHIIGVCGTAMASLAGLLVQQGHAVSGSDVAFYPPMGPALEAWGIPRLEGFLAEHITRELELVIVGNVCRRDNPEVLAAQALGLKLCHVAEALQRFAMGDSKVLVVAGTHGKTTTTSMAAVVLEELEKQPGFFIGGIPANFNLGFRAAKDDGIFVIEGDEYDTAFFEKTPKFWHYRPSTVLLTSVEQDHIDIYPTEQSYFDAFRGLLSRLSESEEKEAKDHVFVADISDSGVRRLLAEIGSREALPSQVAAYGSIDEIESLKASLKPALDGSFKLATVLSYERRDGWSYLQFEWNKSSYCLKLASLGKYNALNALGVALSLHLGFDLNLGDILPAFEVFRGVKRRQEALIIDDNFSLYDDFAHHPTAVRKTIEGFRTELGEDRLVVVYEAKSATACRALHQLEYVSAFDKSDELWLMPLGRQLPEDERLDLPRLQSEIRAKGSSCELIKDDTELVSRLKNLRETAKPSQRICVLLLSNGDLSARLLKGLALATRVI